MQSRCIAKYRQTRDELLKRKSEMEQELAQEKFVEKGEEKAYIREQRDRISQLFDKLQAERKRKNELSQKVHAFQEIKQRLNQAGPLNQEERL